MNTRVLAAFGVIIGGAILLYGAYQAVRLTIKDQPKPPKVLTLVDYLGDDTTQVKITAKGPVGANETYSELTINVSRSSRTLQILQTYQDTPVLDQTFPNNQAAFEDFVRALDLNGFILTNKSTVTSEAGQCATGSRYVYQLFNKNKTIVRSWSSSCGETGTFNGQPTGVRSLFKAQIPDYPKLLRGYKKLPAF